VGKWVDKMKIVEIKDRTALLVERLLEVWEDSVKATHLFLSSSEIDSIKEYVPEALNTVSHLVVMEDEDHIPIAFMGINDTKLEMLFIKNSERGKGLGRKLLNYGIENYHMNELVVNEQNPNALGFYEHMGFIPYKRADLDEQGNPYPILYMRLGK